MNPIVNLIKGNSQIDHNFYESLNLILMLNVDSDLDFQETQSLSVKFLIKEKMLIRENIDLLNQIKGLIEPFFQKSNKLAYLNLHPKLSDDYPVNKEYEAFVKAIGNDEYYGKWGEYSLFAKQSDLQNKFNVFIEQDVNIFEFLVYKLNQNLFRKYSANKTEKGLSPSSVLAVYDKKTLVDEQNTIINSLSLISDKIVSSNRDILFPSLSLGNHAYTTANSALVYLFLHQELSQENREKLLNNKNIWSGINGDEKIFKQPNIWRIVSGSDTVKDIKNLVSKFNNNVLIKLMKSFNEMPSNEAGGLLHLVILNEILNRKDFSVASDVKADFIGKAINTLDQTSLVKANPIENVFNCNYKSLGNKIKLLFEDEDEIQKLEKWIKVKHISDNSGRVFVNVLDKVQDEYKILFLLRDSFLITIFS